MITIGLLYSAFTRTVEALIAARLITGLGIGGTLASLNTLIAEYCSIKRRDLAIGTFISCGALSGILGGAVTAYFIVRFDWSAAFLFGASVSAVVTISLAIWLPESVDYLLNQKPGNALKRINVLLRKMHIDPIDTLPEEIYSSIKPRNSWIIFSRGHLLKTLLMWVSIVMVFTGFYFVASWTPKLLVDSGWTMQEAILANIVINIGGLVSGLVFGYLSGKIGYRWTIRGTLFFAALSIVVFGLAGDNYSMRIILPLVLGFFLFGTLTTQYALLPRLYEAAIRNTGSGWATGVGRLGGMMAPFIAGLMIASGWEGFDLYFVFAITNLVALAAVSLIWSLTEKK
jgi:MFS family permease